MEQVRNARGRYTNFYFHIHQMYCASPFENAIFIKENPLSTSRIIDALNPESLTTSKTVSDTDTSAETTT